MEGGVERTHMKTQFRAAMMSRNIHKVPMLHYKLSQRDIIHGSAFHLICKLVLETAALPQIVNDSPIENVQ